MMRSSITVPRLWLTGLALVASTLAGLAADWPQWLGPNRDSVWRENGILERFPQGGPEVRWRKSIGGGYAGPAVADGRVFVLDRRVAKGSANPENPFQRSSIPGSERVLCLREKDGEAVWEYEYDSPYTISYAAGPRATPLVAGDQVYALGAEGNLLCLDAASGKKVWSRDFKKDYGAKTPVWGFSGHPLLDGDRLVCLVGGPGTVAVAFNKDTGEEIWRSLSAKEPGYCPPTLVEHRGRPLLVIWHPESVNALDPETGRPVWSVPFPVRSALSVATPRLARDRLYLSAFYNGSLMLRLDGETPQVEWKSRRPSERDTTRLHSLMCTPFIENDHLYGVGSYGQLRCLNLESGERIWETFAATTDGKPVRWGNAFIVKQGERFFLFNEKGDLIIARLTPGGYEEIDRANLLAPTNPDPGRLVVWSHPAFANRSVYARNDREIVCVSLADNR